MNAPDLEAHATVAHATLDAAGRVLTAEFPLLELNARAGGGVGRPLALPPLATVARLARRLGIVVSRSVVVADEEADLEMWVRAQPDGSGVRLAISGWRERSAWRPEADGDDIRSDFMHADADWRWETDTSLRLTRVSIEAGRRHGFDAIALLGEPVTSLFALDVDGGAAPLVEALARREALADQAARLRGGDGARVILSATVRRDAAGRFGGFIGAARLADEGKGETPPPPLAADFTTGLDKALRRPLAQIVANADSINAATDGPVASDYADYAADIANAGRHLLALVDDLVDLQAIERPDFALTADRIDLADVARRAAGLLAVRASDKDVTIARPGSDAVLRATGDFRRCLQILVNLIGIAVRYAPGGSQVTVSAFTEGARVGVTVADRGKGIALEDQARVFDKFERVDPMEPGGNGLGLYIAQRLARAMGGDITLASAPGEGARFTLTLPADTARDQDQ